MAVVGAGIWGLFGFGGGLVYTMIEGLNGGVDLYRGKMGEGIAHLINALGVGMMTVGGGSEISVALLGLAGVSATFIEESTVLAFFLGPAGIFVGMILVLGAGAWLLSHTRNDIQTWLLSTQWRRVPPGESDVPAIWSDAQMEKEGYMALTDQGGAHV